MYPSTCWEARGLFCAAAQPKLAGFVWKHETRFLPQILSIPPSPGDPRHYGQKIGRKVLTSFSSCSLEQFRFTPDSFHDHLRLRRVTGVPLTLGVDFKRWHGMGRGKELQSQQEAVQESARTLINALVWWERVPQVKPQPEWLKLGHPKSICFWGQTFRIRTPPTNDRLKRWLFVRLFFFLLFFERNWSNEKFYL